MAPYGLHRLRSWQRRFVARLGSSNGPVLFGSRRNLKSWTDPALAIPDNFGVHPRLAFRVHAVDEATDQSTQSPCARLLPLLYSIFVVPLRSTVVTPLRSAKVVHRITRTTDLLTRLSLPLPGCTDTAMHRLAVASLLVWVSAESRAIRRRTLSGAVSASASTCMRKRSQARLLWISLPVPRLVDLLGKGVVVVCGIKAMSLWPPSLDLRLALALIQCFVLRINITC